MSEPNEVVGHKTLRDPATGRLYHEPLTRAEGDALCALAEEQAKQRAELMPDEESAIRMMWSAHLRLRELGWREACYCPKDGSEFLVIEPGSTGIFECWYEGEWPERPVRLVCELCNCKKAFTATTAIQIGKALGTGAEIWANLQTSYDLAQARAKLAKRRKRA